MLPIADPRPDFSEEPRWPLTIMQHPALEPQFNVAGALAEPGISWTELCARGVQHRHDPSRLDELAYLDSWCAAEHHDVELAVRELAPLMSSPVPGIANGAPIDMVNVLVDAADADHATQLLVDQQLRDAHLWDLLAAAYFEVGKNDDALSATSTAMQLDPSAAPATACHRLARELLLGPESVRKLLLEQLAALNHDPNMSLLRASTSLPRSVLLDDDCATYYANQNLPGEEVLLALLYNRWGTPRDSSDWIEYAWQARELIAETGATELMVAAFDAAVISSECNGDALAAVDTAADAMALGPTQHLMEPKAAWVHGLAADPAKCRAFRAQWLAAHPQ